MAFECCPSTAFKHTSKRDTTAIASSGSGAAVSAALKIVC
jgi:hypothetical protein